MRHVAAAARIAREGLDEALARLAAAGVYVSFDELKGRTPAVRGSQRFEFTDRDFDNPLLQRHFEVTSGAADTHRTSMWRRSGLVKVRREWPVLTKYGRTLPFHVIPRAPSAGAGAPAPG